MTTESNEIPAELSAALASLDTLVRDQRDVVDLLYGVLEQANAELFAGQIAEAQATILTALEAAPKFRANSAVRRMMAECGGHA